MAQVGRFFLDRTGLELARRHRGSKSILNHQKSKVWVLPDRYWCPQKFLTPSEQKVRAVWIFCRWKSKDFPSDSLMSLPYWSKKNLQCRTSIYYVIYTSLFCKIIKIFKNVIYTNPPVYTVFPFILLVPKTKLSKIFQIVIYTNRNIY